jgi:hypothetical protein
VLREAAAAVDEDLAVELLSQSGHFLRPVLAQDGRVLAGSLSVEETTYFGNSFSR